MTSWAQVLADFESCLDRIETALDTGVDTGPTQYRPPRDLPLLPEEHREWAQRLADRNTMLERRAEQLLAENPPPPVGASAAASMASSAPTALARFEYLA